MRGSHDAFRFAPPLVPESAELRWLLERAFAAGPMSTRVVDGQQVVDLAARLGIAPRIGARHRAVALATEIGEAPARALTHAAAAVVAQELRLAAALDELDEAMASLDLAGVLLKGQALIAGGVSATGSRPAGDIDVLVERDVVEPLQQALLARGLVPVGRGYAHQAMPLRHASGGVVEVHRTIPGVRLDPARPRHSATLADVARFGLLAGATAWSTWRPRSALRLPVRDLLVAHALVHVLAQHAFAPGAYPGMLLVGDLLDLGVQREDGAGAVAAIAPWIARAVSFGEASAACALAAALAAADPSLWEEPRSPARLLLDHFVAGRTDPRYAESLKTRFLQRPFSDLPRPLGRLRAAVDVLVPGDDVRPPGSRAWATIAAFARRPALLWRRWRSARAADRALLR